MSISLAKNYVDILDEVYKANSKSDILTNTTFVKEGANAGEVLIPDLTMSGLANYSRSSGYTAGSVNLEYKTVAYNYDRGTKLTVDVMDNQETEEVAFGRLNAELIRTKVVPEKDAFCFATLAGTTGISKVATGATLADGTAVMNAIKVAVDKMDDDEVSEENRILFITPANLSAIKALDTTKSRELLDGFAAVVKVPQSRFKTAITLGNDGYTVPETAKDINFMIVEKSCVIKNDKHVANNIITPEENQTSDGWMMKYRNYGIVKVFPNKVAGIYLHHKA